MDWRRFHGDDDAGDFLDAAIALHRALFDRLAPAERPMFHAWWLRRFNVADALLATDADGPCAMVTMPQCDDYHEFDWAIRTLAIADRARGRVVLPDDVAADRSFTMPGRIDRYQERLLADHVHTPVQLSYVGHLDDSAMCPPSRESERSEAYMVRAAQAADIPATLALMAICYEDVQNPAKDLQRQRSELRQIIRNHAGWYVTATTVADTHRIIGVASYVVRHLQLTGVPVVLVGDLAVHPDHRGRGVARSMQRFAATQCRRAGYQRVYGNIDPDNGASRAQAEALGREVWFGAVRFHRA